MQTDTPNLGKSLLLPPLPLPKPTVTDVKPVPASDPALARWHRLQYLLLAAAFVLVALLWFLPTVGLNILWNILIPIAPALVVVVPGLWRNVCPMATLSLLPQRLGISRHGSLTRRSAALLGMVSISELVLIVPYRHLGLNTSGPLSALMLVVAGGIAFGMGAACKWRSGWCTTLCPIHPVERLYGMAPAMTFRNARCTHCERCTAPCPDSTRAMTPAITGPSTLATVTGHVMIGGFAGFVWGWYQIPDYLGTDAAPHLLSAYLWPLGGALVSLAAYTILYRWVVGTKVARGMLIRVFAAAAVSTYYWFRIPALVGLGPHYGTGLLYDLTGVLPAWSEHLSHVATTSFFLWFLVVRRNPGASWMVRPVFAPNPDR